VTRLHSRLGWQGAVRRARRRQRCSWVVSRFCADGRAAKNLAEPLRDSRRGVALPARMSSRSSAGMSTKARSMSARESGQLVTGWG